jgi:hypothetical protein
VTYLLKARIVEPQKQPLLGNGCVTRDNGVSVVSGVFCAGVPQGSVLSPTLYNLYINDTPQTPGVNLALFADDTCLYATGRKEGYVLRKIQRRLDSMVA